LTDDLRDGPPIVRVETDDGVVGVGSGDTMDGFEAFEHLFIGTDPLAIARQVRILETIDFHAGRYWPLEVALWDILGKSVGKPVHQLLGGKLRDKVKVFGSVGGATLDARAKQAAEFVEQGYVSLRTIPFFDGWEHRPPSQAITDAVG